MPVFDPEKIFEVLARHRVDYVVIGGVAATLHGSNLRTGDVDICPAKNPENLKRLASALVEVRARIRSPDAPQGIPFSCDARFFAQMELCNLTTRFGDFDVSFRPAATEGFDDLKKRSMTYDLGGVRVPTASLEDVIRSKEAAGRPKDLAQLPTLRALRDEIKRRKNHH